MAVAGTQSMVGDPCGPPVGGPVRFRGVGERGYQVVQPEPPRDKGVDDGGTGSVGGGDGETSPPAPEPEPQPAPEPEPDPEPEPEPSPPPSPDPVTDESTLPEPMEVQSVELS